MERGGREKWEEEMEGWNRKEREEVMWRKAMG